MGEGAAGGEAEYEEYDLFGEDSEGCAESKSVHSEEAPHTGPAPRVSMDYFYLSEQGAGRGRGARGMSTKELQNRLRYLGKSDRGGRPVL